MKPVDWVLVTGLQFRRDAAEAIETLQGNDNTGVTCSRGTRISLNMTLAKHKVPFRLRKKIYVSGETDINTCGDSRLYRNPK